MQLKVNTKLNYINASTQTKFPKNTKTFQPKYQHSPQQQTNTNQCCKENNIKTSEVIQKETNITTKNLNIESNNVDSIEINIQKKIDEISDKFTEIEDSISCITINTQIQQFISNNSIETQQNLYTELDTFQLQESEERKSTPITLPRIKCQPRRHNKNRITNAIRDISKTGAVFKINTKVSFN